MVLLRFLHGTPSLARQGSTLSREAHREHTPLLSLLFAFFSPSSLHPNLHISTTSDVALLVLVGTVLSCPGPVAQKQRSPHSNSPDCHALVRRGAFRMESLGLFFPPSHGTAIGTVVQLLQ
ncbi:hypothetical protein GQ43DRAFT_442778 [Delitschia confertaspora ATCC 74209]|uniref:Uncharacterized protein n=1 Tax=Delitschia confertaspora ATCC 74209 TaxID=1513339 RepID=A0A9P4JMC7_9PLEO|nr:hypothetical protein GQ43DRAFT_442778 [Delitschia confertaspora ATCC 74209]